MRVSDVACNVLGAGFEVEVLCSGEGSISYLGFRVEGQEAKLGLRASEQRKLGFRISEHT